MSVHVCVGGCVLVFVLWWLIHTRTHTHTHAHTRTYMHTRAHTHTHSHSHSHTHTHTHTHLHTTGQYARLRFASLQSAIQLAEEANTDSLRNAAMSESIAEEEDTSIVS